MSLKRRRELVQPDEAGCMVAVPLPPPSYAPNPLIRHLPAGTELVRIFDPTRYGATALQFRTFGPLLRFDHQQPTSTGHPAEHANRGVYYAALTLSGCLVEVFGDSRLVEFGHRHVAFPCLTREVHVLDLCGPGAMRAGTVAAIAKADHRLSQAWSRYFYEQLPISPTVDGLIYLNAHNDEVAVALYERAADALELSDQQNTASRRPGYPHVILKAAFDNHLIVEPLT